MPFLWLYLPDFWTIFPPVFHSYAEELSILYEDAILGYMASAKWFLKILQISSWAWSGFVHALIPTQKHLWGSLWWVRTKLDKKETQSQANRGGFHLGKAYYPLPIHQALSSGLRGSASPGVETVNAQPRPLWIPFISSVLSSPSLHSLCYNLQRITFDTGANSPIWNQKHLRVTSPYGQPTAND